MKITITISIFISTILIVIICQVENTVDPVGSLIEIYKQTDNIILSRLVVIQVFKDDDINEYGWFWRLTESDIWFFF